MSARGFTLLEVLVGVGVLGLILGVLYGGVSFALQGARRQEAVIAKTGDYDAVDRALRRMIAEADPGAANPGAANPGAANPGGVSAVPLTGAVGRMAFSSRMPDGAAADMAIGISGGTVLLRWSPRRTGRPIGPGPAPLEAELLRGARRIDLAYWGKSGWRTTWADPVLPTLVRLRVTFPAGDPRHWPDMVMATRRQPP